MQIAEYAKELADRMPGNLKVLHELKHSRQLDVACPSMSYIVRVQRALSIKESVFQASLVI